MKPLLSCASALLLALSAPAMADQVIADDLIVQNDACFGNACADGESFPNFWQVKFKSFAPTVIFEDTNTGEHDWRLQANTESVNGFYLRNEDTTNTPFTILGDAPSNSLFVAGDGRVGMGTALPQTALHMAGSIPGLTLENTSGAGNWRATVGDTGYALTDTTAGVSPFVIENGAHGNSFWMKPDGKLGLGTFAPEGKLHVKGNGVQLSYLESGDGGAVQLRFRTDSENRRFLAVNNANQVKSQIIFKDNEILFTGQTDSGANRWLTIGPSGILSQGGTCNINPCDRTFDPSYFTVPPIEERAAYMWDNMHLPAIGPTKADEPINLTEKTTGIIHELEVAHIYIERLHKELADEVARNAAQEARITALEALFAPK